MSVIPVDGLRYTANLRWLERVGRRSTLRTTERLERHWFVHRGKHTGFADLDASGCPDGLPALSLALMTLIGGGRWVALVEGDATGGDTLCALVKARDGAVLADGEDVFSDRAVALKAFERSRSPDWAPHGTPGLAGARSGTANPRSPSWIRTSGNGWRCSAAPGGAGWVSLSPLAS